MCDDYIKSAKIINSIILHQKSLKSLIYTEKIKNKPKIFALVTKTLEKVDFFKKLIEKSDLEIKNFGKNSSLVYVLLFEKYFGRGIKGGGLVKRKIDKHEVVLSKNFEILIKDKSSGNLVSEKSQKTVKFLRINSLKTKSEDVLKVLKAEFSSCVFKADDHIKDLFRVTIDQKSSKNLHLHEIIKFGKALFQDKPSCFPAHILADTLKKSSFTDYDVVDATAAPGNKSTHLLSLISDSSQLISFDKSPKRFEILKERCNLLVPESVRKNQLTILNEDFLAVNVMDQQFNNVRGILVDPTCSGSGRSEHGKVNLTKSRLNDLAQFQSKIILKAMSFPKVQFVVYSTCSIRMEENEDVISKVLSANKQFRLKKIEMKWKQRGKKSTDETNHLTRKQREAVLRVNKSAEKSGLTGFFVALFERSNKRKKGKNASLVLYKRPKIM